MIIVKNRELLIPNNERYIGTTYDTETENRVFQVPRYSQRGVDLAALTFRLDIQYANESYDTIVLDKEIGEAFVILIWRITSSTLQVPGTMYIGLRAVDNEATVKWSSFSAAMYVERHLNTPGNYGGGLSEIEQMEQDHQYMKGVVNELKEHIDYTFESEAWAVGKRDGEDVPATDPTYHNNSKYYSEQAGASATAAANSATAAAGSATAAHDDSEAVAASRAQIAQNASNIAIQTARIDQFTHLAEGSTTGDAELMDARVGADGVTYTSAGAATRANDSLLKSHLDAISNMDTALKGTFGRGSLDAQGVPYADQSTRQYRICNTDFVKYAPGDKVVIADGFAIAVDYYSAALVSSGVFVSSDYWETGTYTFTNAAPYQKVVVKRVSENTSEVADIDVFKNAVRFIISDTIVQCEAYIDTTNANLRQMQTKYINCESGTFEDANGAVKKVNVKRLRNIIPISIDGYDGIVIPDGYQAWIFRLDKDGTAISAVGSWLTGTVDLTNASRFASTVKYLNIAFKKTDAQDSDISAYASDVADGLILIPKQNFMYDESYALALETADTLLNLNGLINLYGKYSTHNSYKASGFIRVTEGQKVNYNLRGTTTLTILAFYTDRNEDTFVSASSVVGTGAYKSGEWTAPGNGYIRACCENYNFNQAYLYTPLEVNKRNFGGEAVEKSLNVLLMGDSIFGNDGEIAGYLSELCKSCVNGAFGGTQVSVRPYTSDAFRFFDGVNIITALCTQTWTDQDSAATTLESTYPWVPGRLATLKAVDMSDIDLLIMDWGTNDYTAGATIETITTAYGTVIDLLQETYPELRILITTPIWRYWGTPQDNENGDTKIYNVSTLKEIALAIEQYAKDKRISVLNAYQNLPLSYNTADTYFDSGDKTHLNAFGNKVYAELLHGKIRSIY